jgi:dihydropteroate synthase
VKDTIFNSNITLNCQGKLIEFDKPIIMGIINTTPDSFFEGSRNQSSTQLLNQVEKFINEGVDIVDIGGYSSRPGANEVTENDEIKRVLPAVKNIREKYPNLLISIDTFRPTVAKTALENGTNIINDISGGQFDETIYKIASDFSAPYIMMHMRGTPQNMQCKTEYDNLMKDLIYYFSDRIQLAQKLGLKDIIIDPGLGFGKTLDQNYEIIKHLDLFKVLEKPILIGASRKSMLYKLLSTSANEALNATTAINTISLMNGAHILRVHDVKEAVELKKIYRKINEVSL